MILEFVGLPGSGKTTAEEVLREELRKNGVSLLSRKDLERRYLVERPILRFFGKSALYAPLWLRYCKLCFASGAIRKPFQRYRGASGYWLLKDYILSQFYEHSVKSQNGTAAVYCPSEGFVQHMVSEAVWGEGAAALVKDFTSSSFIGHLCLVYIKVDKEPGFQRLLERGVPKTWPPESRKPAGAEKAYSRFFEVMEAQVELVQEKGAQVIPVDASFDIPDLERQMHVVAGLVLDQILHG